MDRKYGKIIELGQRQFMRDLVCAKDKIDFLAERRTFGCRLSLGVHQIKRRWNIQFAVDDGELILHVATRLINKLSSFNRHVTRSARTIDSDSVATTAASCGQRCCDESP